MAPFCSAPVVYFYSALDMLMVVRVIVSRQHNENWSSQPPIDVIRHDTL